jgi:hypothetical protein
MVGRSRAASNSDASVLIATNVTLAAKPNAKSAMNRKWDVRRQDGGGEDRGVKERPHNGRGPRTMARDDKTHDRLGDNQTESEG